MNGSYDICGECGQTYGTRLKDVMGMWGGICALCGRDTYLANARHDYDLTDDAIEAILKPVLTVTTRNGTTYQFTQGLALFRRQPYAGSPVEMDDCRWLKCMSVHIRIGEGIRLMYAPPYDSKVGMLTSSPVTWIEGHDEALDRMGDV